MPWDPKHALPYKDIHTFVQSICACTSGNCGGQRVLLLTKSFEFMKCLKVLQWIHLYGPLLSGTPESVEDYVIRNRYMCSTIGLVINYYKMSVTCILIYAEYNEILENDFEQSFIHRF